MKKFSIILIMVMLLNLFAFTMPASAYQYPNGFWSLNSGYVTACENNDYKNIIKYGVAEIELVSKTADCYEKRELMVSRYKSVGLAYAALGDYTNAADIFGKLYEYTKNIDEYYNYARDAKARMTQYQPEMHLYTDNGDYTYYGAKNEHKNGVLFGICADGKSRSSTPHESLLLTYQEIGQTLLAFNKNVIRVASNENLAVEFALNCSREGDDIRNIHSMSSSLYEISELFSQYPDVPIYLRFAAEFDIWSNPVDAESFKSAFRYVSQYFKTRNSNVAIVWSPNFVSSWNIKNIDDYYPGDEYVDWVGMSLYAQKYFLGNPDASETDQIAFKTGANSNPVIVVKEIVEKYGDRKPIMISESGCGHTVVQKNENTTDFAVQRLREYLCYLPMVYPQIKVIAYFDNYVTSNAESYDFRLSSNSKMLNEYVRLTKTARFIQDEHENSSDLSYRKIWNTIYLNSIFPVSCYAHKYNTELEKVTYFIDDNYVGVATEIPYTSYIDAGNYPGTHTLKAIALFKDGQTMTKSYTVNIAAPYRDITVEISGEKIYFDQDPMLYNNRTMVPMRKIFEELGATVTWDQNTQTVTGKKGERTVTVTIGSNTMYVNNTKYTLDTPPMVVSGRTLVPARAIAEGMGAKVSWNQDNALVSITPMKAKWSEWSESLPNYVNEDMYYIEERTEYKYRERPWETYTSTNPNSYDRYEGSNTTYGNWSEWQNSYISSSDTLQVETRTQSSPTEYFYAHYCTGNISDSSNRYKTANYKFYDQCSYHELGWRSEPLPGAPDGVGYLLYKDNGDKYRCSNTCYRWYVFDTRGGDYTQYRSRTVTTTYTYGRWGSWSSWSDWGTYRPTSPYVGYEGLETKSRTMYRFKEK
ncbi:MAG: hypothetical protein IKV86_01635 [Clostridia bacterium]|nr:hypothetical protein [Clostridia bacterium]